MLKWDSLGFWVWVFECANELWWNHFSYKKVEQQKRRMEWIQRIQSESMRTAMTHLILVQSAMKYKNYCTYSKGTMCCAWVFKAIVATLIWIALSNENEMEMQNMQYVEATIHPYVCMCVCIKLPNTHTFVSYTVLLFSCAVACFSHRRVVCSICK